MADASEEISDDVWGVIGLIFLVVVGYWFFSEDDLEDVAQEYVEAALDGDGETMAELSTEFMPYFGRVNFMLDNPSRGGFWDSVMNAAAINELNASLERSQQRIADRYERRVERNDGLDDVEIITYATKELPTNDLSFWAWIVSFFEDGPDVPEYIEDEAGLAIAKITYDDGSLNYLVLALTHVESSDYTIEGWTVTSILRTSSVDAGYDVDDIESREKKLNELVQKFKYED